MLTNLPLYRQEQIFARAGHISEKLEYISARILSQIKKNAFDITSTVGPPPQNRVLQTGDRSWPVPRSDLLLLA